MPTLCSEVKRHRVMPTFHLIIGSSYRRLEVNLCQKPVTDVLALRQILPHHPQPQHAVNENHSKALGYENNWHSNITTPKHTHIYIYIYIWWPIFNRSRNLWLGYYKFLLYHNSVTRFQLFCFMLSMLLDRIAGNLWIILLQLRGLWGLAPSNLSILRKIDMSKSQWSPVV